MVSTDAEFAAMADASRIKGLVFVTCRRFVEENYGQEGYERVVSGLGPEARAAFDEPAVSELYPEAHMHAFVTRMYTVLAEGDDEAFCDMIRGIARMGISKFFRLILSLTSPVFVVKRIPLLFKRLREGPAELQIELDSAHIVVHYDKFPWCGDPIYRLTSMANIQAAVEATGAACPRVTVSECSSTSMSLVIDLERSERRLSALPTG
jgi:hypothetical protein